MTLTCILHYKKCGSYPSVKALSDINKEKIIKVKKLQESVGGANHHKEQCCNVPGTFIDGKHGIHLEPCHKKFN